MHMRAINQKGAENGEKRTTKNGWLEVWLYHFNRKPLRAFRTIQKRRKEYIYALIHVVYRFHIPKTWRKKHTPNPIQWRAFYIHAYVKHWSVLLFELEMCLTSLRCCWFFFLHSNTLRRFFFSLSNIMYCIMWHFVWCVATMWAWSVWSVGAYVMTNRKRESENTMHAGRCS